MIIVRMFSLLRAIKCLKDFYHLQCNISQFYLKVIRSYSLLDNKESLVP